MFSFQIHIKNKDFRGENDFHKYVIYKCQKLWLNINSWKWKRKFWRQTKLKYSDHFPTLNSCFCCYLIITSQLLYLFITHKLELFFLNRTFYLWISISSPLESIWPMSEAIITFVTHLRSFLSLIFILEIFIALAVRS